MLLVSSEIIEVIGLSDRILVVRAGRIVPDLEPGRRPSKAFWSTLCATAPAIIGRAAQTRRCSRWDNCAPESAGTP